MDDQSFHEIQLSGKQLVFLFMCAVVMTVVVFLFGVSVGRQVRGSAAPPALVAAAGSTDTPVPADAPPPPTQTASNELSYADALQGKDVDDPSKAVPPTPPADQPPAPVASSVAATSLAAPKTAPAPAVPAPAPAKPAPAPAKTPAPVKGAAAAKAAPAAGGWVVQVGAFNVNTVAAKEVTELQGKGYAAFVFTEPATTPGPRYKVRVGPYSARAEADQTMKSLTKAGYRPLIKR